jgi:hypothetical protein
MAPVKVTPIRHGEQKGKGKSTYRRNVAEHDEWPKVVVAVPPGLEADSTPCPHGRIFSGNRSCSNRERANAIGLAASLIS